MIEETFFQKIETKFSVSKNCLKSIWNEIEEVNKKVVTCDYIFQRGSKPGSQCSNDVVEGSTKCRAHQKFDNKHVVKNIPTEKTPLPSRVSVLNITKNSYGNFEHKATGFVFNSDKLVYGKQVGDKVVPLSTTDVKACIRNSFKYSEDGVAKPDPEFPLENETEYID